jgi:hypothetical protein
MVDESITINVLIKIPIFFLKTLRTFGTEGPLPPTSQAKMTLTLDDNAPPSKWNFSISSQPFSSDYF